MYKDFQHDAIAVTHLLYVSEVDLHKVKSWTHQGAVCPASSLPPFWFHSRCQLQLGQLPDSAACLSTPALPLCSLACSVSVLLGQMTHTIIAGFIKEVQWLVSTQKHCGEVCQRQWGLIKQSDGGPGKNQVEGREKGKELLTKRCHG